MYASIESLYMETGWVSLGERREMKKISLFYKIRHNLAPGYLVDLLPGQVQDSSSYNLRNSDNYRIPTYRLQSSLLSFFPSTLHLWNSLSAEIRNIPTLNQFKYALKRKYSSYNVPKYFKIGDRKHNIILTRLRNLCSSLNADLFRVNLSNTATCFCGYFSEDLIHYFFDCNNYFSQRQLLLRKINDIANLSYEDILYGSDLLSLSDNIKIQNHIIYYIKSTKRF